MDADRRHFLLRRLHSLTGVVPLTVFLFEHFYTNSKAIFGPEAFDEATQFLHQIPYLLGIGEVLILLLPIAFHGIYGLMIASEGSVNLQYYPRNRNLMYLLQRISGIIVFLFIIYHVWNTRMQTVLYDTHIDFAYMAQYLNSVGIQLIYVVGVVAAVFHLSNGLWSFSITWGIIRTPLGQRNFFYACMGLFVVMTAAGLRIIFEFDPALV